MRGNDRAQDEKRRRPGRQVCGWTGNEPRGVTGEKDEKEWQHRVKEGRRRRDKSEMRCK